jgi:hypothetical protein
VALRVEHTEGLWELSVTLKHAYEPLAAVIVRQMLTNDGAR